jgi:hypothetical protein
MLMIQEFLAELVVSRHEKRDSQLMELNEMPLYPTEVSRTAGDDPSSSPFLTL